MTRGLEQLAVLHGEWTSVSEKYSEGRGHMTVAPTEDGKFVLVDTREENALFPHGTQLIGSDEAREECTVLYYDSRGVHRVYRMSVADGVWKIWREAPGFNQRYIGKIIDGGKTIAGHWEFSEDGKTWQVDFDLTYTKVAG